MTRNWAPLVIVLTGIAALIGITLGAHVYRWEAACWISAAIIQAVTIVIRSEK